MNDIRPVDFGSTQCAPVFVVGAVRSGSTLLRLMLDSHPNIANPGECDFLFELVGDDGISPDTEVYRNWLGTNRIFLAMGLEFDESHSYCELMESFIAQLSQVDSVLTMNIHRNFHRIPRIFRKARYIHLVRDPRDVARSCIGMGWAGHVYRGVDIWSAAELSWDRLKAGLDPGDYLEVRYEELLCDPVGVLGRICGFLGVSYSDQMLEYPRHSTYSAPDRKLCYQWKKNYRIRELELVDGKVGKMLVSRGYELSGHTAGSPFVLEWAVIEVHNKTYRIRRQIARYGFRLYLESFAASRMGIARWKAVCQARKNAIDIRYLK